MLNGLSIRHFAITNDLRVRFDTDFNVLTRETGSGKLIILNAVILSLGGRANTSMGRCDNRRERTAVSLSRPMPRHSATTLTEKPKSTSQIEQRRWVDGIYSAIKVKMKAGDALLFVDAISHGLAKRVNGGNRRIIVYRYGPSWGNFRHGYQVSPELLERLTPQRRQIVWPQKFIPRTPQKKVD
ncbi:MAG: hypothetical protein AAF614_35795 [Chloroflexota bacterium]